MAKRSLPSRATTSWLGPRTGATTSKRAELSARAFRRALAATALLTLCGCVTVPEFQALRRRVDAVEKGKGAGGDDWAGKSGAATSGSSGGGSRLADLDAEVAALHDEVGRLQGEVDSLKKELAKIRGGAAAPAGAAAPGAEAAPGAAAAGAAGAGA